MWIGGTWCLWVCFLCVSEVLACFGGLCRRVAPFIVWGQGVCARIMSGVLSGIGLLLLLYWCGCCWWYLVFFFFLPCMGLDEHLPRVKWMLIQNSKLNTIGEARLSAVDSWMHGRSVHPYTSYKICTIRLSTWLVFILANSGILFVWLGSFAPQRKEEETVVSCFFVVLLGLSHQCFVLFHFYFDVRSIIMHELIQTCGMFYYSFFWSFRCEIDCAELVVSVSCMFAHPPEDTN